MSDTTATPRIGFIDGWRWLGAGFARYRRKPFLLIGWWLIARLIPALLGFIPVVGLVLSGLIGPFLTVGLMAGYRALDTAATVTGQPAKAIRFDVLFSGFASRPLPLLALGVLQCLAGLGSAFGLVAMGFNDDALQQIMLGGAAGGLPPTPPDVSLGGLLLLVWANIFVWLVLSYAALLVAWRNFGLGKALFFSLVATGRAGYGLSGLFAAVFVYCGLLPILLFILLGGTQPALIFLGLLVAMVLAPTVMSAVYTSYCAILSESAATAASTPPATEA